MTDISHREPFRNRQLKLQKEWHTYDWGERFGNDFMGNKKMLWEEVKQVRKGEQARDEMVKDVNGQMLWNGVKVRMRLAQYFRCQGIKCGRCQGGKYKCMWQLADVSVGREN